ncbi:MAG: 4-hydroxy-3-methylbut-2-enyl diphosphate reductase [Planctomycetota bacterium]|nr:4-hydroxy-3-methylbut-2-enyl diphosphate reductase [Planctomycetota bacterium]MDI6787655.1 4-hydroxy-3-methylbut-2-enyl diphosphate reductase [Planctomycetota bacterium]
MRLQVAKDTGFCWGVKRALDIALKNAKSKYKVYTYGPLIHNASVVETLKIKGIEPFTNKKRVSFPTILVIRAHGISPAVRKKLSVRGYNIVDATCPHVKKSQKMAQAYADRGYQIMIAGDKKHAEVISLLGYSDNKKYPYRAIVISSIKEAQQLLKNKLHLLNKKICILAQSTFQPHLYQEIVNIIKTKIPSDIEFVVLNTICQAPARRQTAVKDLAKQVSAMVVVGDSQSANTTNLTLLARSMKIPTFQVASADELPMKKLKQYYTIGICTGTSTPDWVIKEVVEKLASEPRLPAAGRHIS